jgi:hypothetical protein
MDKHTFDSLNSSQVVKKTSTTIYPYGSKTPLKLIGKSTLKAHVNDKLWEIEFHIIAGTGKPLIGHKTATDLGLLHIGMLNTLDVNTDSIISSFKDRFTGLGKLKDFQLRLHIDESVQPVAQPVRKIPFKMRKQVEEQIKQLEEMDVIEKIEGPTPWVSPIVVVPKPSGNARLCVDMRQANKRTLPYSKC